MMKIVLAYSGGLDTWVLLSWLKETCDAEMIAFCANIGQEEELCESNPRLGKTLTFLRFLSDYASNFT